MGVCISWGLGSFLFQAIKLKTTHKFVESQVANLLLGKPFINYKNVMSANSMTLLNSLQLHLTVDATLVLFPYLPPFPGCT